MDDKFVVKDSGQRQEFDSGAKRDTQDGKPRFDLIPIKPLTRVANHYGKGAKKYDEWNWKKGIPMSRCYASMLRHIYQFAAGETDEDHLAAVVFNAFCLMDYQESGRTDLDDLQQVRS